MPSTEVLITFTLAALLLSLAPGPSNFYVMARAIAQGAAGGAVAALGLAAGSLVHVLAAVWGLSAVFSHSPGLYLAIKLAGAAYLVYLGLRYLREAAPAPAQAPAGPRHKPLGSVFRESVIIEVTNPKTALFFIAFLPQFVVPESGSVGQQLLVLGLIVTVSALPCDLLIAFCASKLTRWLNRHQRAQVLQEQVSGGILLSLGAYIAGDELWSRTP